MLVVALCTAIATLCVVALVKRPVRIPLIWAMVGLVLAIGFGADAALNAGGDDVTQRGKDICRTRSGWTAIESAKDQPHRVFCADGRRGGYTF